HIDAVHQLPTSRLSHAYRDVQTATAQMSLFLDAVFTGIHTVKTHEGEAFHREKFDELVKNARKKVIRASNLAALVQALTILGWQGVYPLILVFGGGLIFTGELTVGALTG